MRSLDRQQCWLRRWVGKGCFASRSQGNCVYKWPPSSTICKPIPGLSCQSLHLKQFPINKHQFVFIMELSETVESWNQSQCQSINECVHPSMCRNYLAIRKNDAFCLQNKPCSERWILNLFSHVCNLDFFKRHEGGKGLCGKWRRRAREEKWEKKG